MPGMQRLKVTSSDLLPEIDDPLVCNWAQYKGLWHTECHFFLTTTEDNKINYTFEEQPFDGVCPNCERRVEVIDRHFGRKAAKK